MQKACHAIRCGFEAFWTKGRTKPSRLPARACAIAVRNPFLTNGAPQELKKPNLERLGFQAADKVGVHIFSSPAKPGLIKYRVDFAAFLFYSHTPALSLGGGLASREGFVIILKAQPRKVGLLLKPAYFEYLRIAD